MFYQDYIVYQKWRACARLHNSPSIPKKEFIRGIPNSQAFRISFVLFSSNNITLAGQHRMIAICLLLEICQALLLD